METGNSSPNILYKKGSKAAPENYRPVSLTCVSSKIMESLIKDDIMQHLSRNGLVNKTQHGFMKGKSCTTNLLEFLDKVPTERLLKKVQSHGISG